MRSGCQNITLAITPCNGVPCRDGYAPLNTPGTLGTDSTRHPSRHCVARRAGADFDVHGPPLTRAGAHGRGAAHPNLPQLVTPAGERSAPASTSSTSCGETPSRRSTGAPWPDAYLGAGGRGRGGGRPPTPTVSQRPCALIGRRGLAVSSSSHRDSAHQAREPRVSRASGDMRRVWRDDAHALACGRSQWPLWSPPPSAGGVVYGGVSFIQTYDSASDGRGVWRANAYRDDQPVGARHHGRGRGASGGSPALRTRPSRGAPR
jgi:hypothetical protein